MRRSCRVIPASSAVPEAKHSRPLREAIDATAAKHSKPLREAIDAWLCVPTELRFPC